MFACPFLVDYLWTLRFGVASSVCRAQKTRLFSPPGADEAVGEIPTVGPQSCLWTWEYGPLLLGLRLLEPVCLLMSAQRLGKGSVSPVSPSTLLVKNICHCSAGTGNSEIASSQHLFFFLNYLSLCVWIIFCGKVWHHTHSLQAPTSAAGPPPTTKWCLADRRAVCSPLLLWSEAVMSRLPCNFVLARAASPC